MPNETDPNQNPNPNPTGPVQPSAPVEDPHQTPHPTKFDPQASQQSRRLDQTMSSKSVGNKAPEDALEIPEPVSGREL